MDSLGARVFFPWAFVDFWGARFLIIPGLRRFRALVTLVSCVWCFSSFPIFFFPNGRVFQGGPGGYMGALGKRGVYKEGGNKGGHTLTFFLNGFFGLFWGIFFPPLFVVFGRKA